MNSDSFALFVQTVITSFHPKVPIPIYELMSLCAGLPREAVSIFFLIAENSDDEFGLKRTKYFVTRTTFYASPVYLGLNSVIQAMLWFWLAPRNAAAYFGIPTLCNEMKA